MQNKNNKFAWLSRVVRVGLQPLSTAISVTSLSRMAQTLYTSASRKASMQVLKGLPQRHLCLFMLLFPHHTPPKALQFHWLRYFTAMG